MWDYWYELRQILKQMANPPLWEEKVVDRKLSMCYSSSKNNLKQLVIKQPVSKTGFKRGQRR